MSAAFTRRATRNAVATTSKVRLPSTSSSAAVGTSRSFTPRLHRRSLATAVDEYTQQQQRAQKSSSSSHHQIFPCVDQNESREHRLRQAHQLRAQNNPRNNPQLQFQPRASDATAATNVEDGPEPAYTNRVTGYKTYHHPETFELDYGSSLPSFDLAYETWGKLNADKTNVILLHTGLSASSHAKSTPENPAEGWWERFIGPGRPIDTNKFFVICTNVLGGCYGSTGPSSPHPEDGQPWATRFPIISVFDMVRAQFKLLDHLGIQRLYASVGSSMGGQQTIAAAHLEPERVGKVASISGTARSSPGSIAMRYAQRSVLMADPNWNRGFYYDGLPPHTGMKLARQIGTITYRSGPEWEQRFGRQRRQPLNPATQGPVTPALCPDFLIETYLDHQGEQFCLKYDANSFLYISKAMDLFDMSTESLEELAKARSHSPLHVSDASTQHQQLQLQDTVAAGAQASSTTSKPKKHQKPSHISSIFSSHSYLPSLAKGLSNLRDHPMLILGAQSDILFPIDQQRELAEAVRMNGNKQVAYYELDSPYGHDTFLIDLQNVGGALNGFLSSCAD